MRVLDLRPGREKQDIDWARSVLDSEIGHPSKTVMLVRGSSQDVSHFADRAGARSDPFPWRAVIWVRDPRLLSDEAHTQWFGDDHEIVAVVLDFDDRPIARLQVSATLYQIEMAFLSAQQGGQQ